MKRFGLATLVALVISLVTAAPAVAVSGIGAPTGVRGSDGGGVAVITWDRVDGAEGYNVYRDNQYIDTVGAPPYRDGVSGSHRYYITAFANGDFSTKSNEVSVSVSEEREEAVAPAPAALTAPTNVSVRNSGSQLRLSWNAVSGAGGYNVYRDNQYVDTVTSTSWSGPTGDHSFYVTSFDSSKTTFSGRSNTVRSEAPVVVTTTTTAPPVVAPPAPVAQPAPPVIAPPVAPVVQETPAPPEPVVSPTPVYTPVEPVVAQPAPVPQPPVGPPEPPQPVTQPEPEVPAPAEPPAVQDPEPAVPEIQAPAPAVAESVETESVETESVEAEEFVPASQLPDDNDNDDNDGSDDDVVADINEPVEIDSPADNESDATNDVVSDANEGEGDPVDEPLSQTAPEAVNVGGPDINEPTESEPAPDPVAPTPPVELVADVDEVIVRDPEDLEITEDDDSDGGDGDGPDRDEAEDDSSDEPLGDPGDSSPLPTQFDATPDVPVVRPEDEHGDPFAFDGDGDGDSDDTSEYDWSGSAPDGLDAYDGVQGGETYPTESQAVGEGDYGGDQDDGFGSVAENATGGADSTSTGGNSPAQSNIDLESETVSGLADTSTPASVTTESITSGLGFDISFVNVGAGVTTTSTQQVTHDSNGTTTVSNQDDVSIEAEAGVGVPLVGGVGASGGEISSHIVENTGATEVVQDALEDGTLYDTSDVGAIPEGLTATEIGEPGIGIFDSGPTRSPTTETGTSIGVEVGEFEVELSLDGTTATTTTTSQSGLDTTIVTNHGDTLEVGTGQTSITETQTTIETNQNGISVNGVGTPTSDVVTITDTTQHTETVDIVYANSANGQTAAQEQADSGEPVLGEDGFYDVTTTVTQTHTETLDIGSIDLVAGSSGFSDDDPIVTNQEVEQQTVTEHMQGEPGEAPDPSWGWFDFTESDDQLGQSSEHSISETPQDGHDGFTVSQTSNGSIPLAAPIETVTADTTGGLTLEMTPEELQANAAEAALSYPDNSVLQDLADGVSLPEAVSNDAESGWFSPFANWWGHSNATTVEALEAIAVEEALSDGDGGDGDGFSSEQSNGDAASDSDDDAEHDGFTSEAQFSYATLYTVHGTVGDSSDDDDDDNHDGFSSESPYSHSSTNNVNSSSSDTSSSSDDDDNDDEPATSESAYSYTSRYTVHSSHSDSDNDDGYSSETSGGWCSS